MKTYHAGEILYSPTQPSEVLFILKKGRVRVFRVSADGRALTTAIISPGTIFGEMVLLGQHMYDNYAEALDDTVVCVMSRADIHKFLLSDARIAARITAILGRRLADLEQRLSDSVFKTVAQRVATTLTTLTSAQPPAGLLRPVGRHRQIALTHEQRAALAGTSRETCTKVLRDYADHGLLSLARGRITVLDPRRPRRHLPRNLHQGAARLRRPRSAEPGSRTHHRPRPRTAQGCCGLTSPHRNELPRD
ncbi:Crp/Fnr family transcriptional regulator [Streptomyces chengmaiensis]